MNALALALLGAHTYLRFGGYDRLVVGARTQAPLVILPALDSMLIIDRAKRHAVAALLRSGEPILKMIKREPARYAASFVAFAVTSAGEIDIEWCWGEFGDVPHAERLTPEHARALHVLMNSNAHFKRPHGLPGAENVWGRL